MLLFHIKELKLRSYYILLTYLLTSIVVYQYHESLLLILIKPLISLQLLDHFIYTSIAEAFISYVKLTLFISILIIIPIILIHLWLFLIPGLYTNERSQITLKLVSLSIIFFIILERTINYLLPHIYEFFVNYGNDLIVLEAKINDYILLTTNFILTTIGILLLIIIIYHLNIKPSFLISIRKYIVLINLIIAGLISPPDVINQLLISIPLIISYELLIYLKIRNIIMNEYIGN